MDGERGVKVAGTEFEENSSEKVERRKFIQFTRVLVYRINPISNFHGGGKAKHRNFSGS